MTDSFEFDAVDTVTSPLFRAPSADGRMMYPVEHMDSTDWITPVTSLPGFGRRNTPQILVVASDVTSIEYRVLANRPIVRYTLNKPNALWPQQVSVEEWSGFRENLGFTGADYDKEYIANSLYTAERAGHEYETRSIDLTGYTDFPVNILDPESVEDPDSSFTWQVGAPYLVFGNVYASAMPGALIDVGERFTKAVVAALPGFSIRPFGSVSGHIAGNVNLEFSDGRTYPWKTLNGRKTEHRVSSKNFPFEIPIPQNISATSKREALEKFAALVTEITGQLQSKNAVVCGSCSGDGVIVS